MHQSVEALERFVDLHRRALDQLAAQDPGPDPEQIEQHQKKIDILSADIAADQGLIDAYLDAVACGDDIRSATRLVRIQYLAATMVEDAARMDGQDE